MTEKTKKKFEAIVSKKREVMEADRILDIIATFLALKEVEELQWVGGCVRLFAEDERQIQFDEITTVHDDEKKKLMDLSSEKVRDVLKKNYNELTELGMVVCINNGLYIYPC